MRWPGHWWTGRYRRMPGFACAVMPSGPSATSSTMRGIGNEVMTTSQLFATSATDPPVDAPRSVQRLTAAGSGRTPPPRGWCPDDIAAHGATHVADADETDLHGTCLPSLRCGEAIQFGRVVHQDALARRGAGDKVAELIEQGGGVGHRIHPGMRPVCSPQTTFRYRGDQRPHVGFRVGEWRAGRGHPIGAGLDPGVAAIQQAQRLPGTAGARCQARLARRRNDRSRSAPGAAPASRRAASIVSPSA